MSKAPFIYMRVCGQTYTLNNHLKEEVLDQIVMEILKHFPPDADVEFSKKRIL